MSGSSLRQLKLLPGVEGVQGEPVLMQPQGSSMLGEEGEQGELEDPVQGGWEMK